MTLVKDTTPAQSTENQLKDENYRPSYEKLLHRLERHVVLGYPNCDAGTVETVRGSIEHNLFVIKHQLDKVLDLIYKLDPEAYRADGDHGYSTLFSEAISLPPEHKQLISDAITNTVGLLLNFPNEIEPSYHLFTLVKDIPVINNITLMGPMTSLQLAEVLLNTNLDD